ncbi:hypothetical protein NA57DRAFT_64214 [Rhizodiscina lignyota]|uniref:Cupin type-1 domain-containing protein n=1 Tax=Rhizodiscina lignyota TaxID=1504668 RepID=A0A9P4IGR1_9PEZI|nr:hypothetical protein NA57DRAFT_64214 [Rhizodiscina lignyota]
MPESKSYNLEPTKLIPNSPYPLLHYPNFFDPEDGSYDAAKVHDTFVSNGWDTQWIFRYGSTQRSHYHSQAHECMAVLSGAATIRFGVADTDPDMQNNTYGEGKEEGGVEVDAKAGDVFIIPAGVSHKTFNASPAEEFKLLTPGEGHGIPGPDARQTLQEIPISGFTMIGAYPHENGVWDFCAGGEQTGEYEKVWSVPKPSRDPVMGEAGLCELWK